MKTEITLKTSQLKLLLEVLKQFETVKNKKIAYFALRNTHILIDELSPLIELEKQFYSDEYNIFDNKRNKLVEENQLKDENGKPLVNHNGPVFGDKLEAVNKKWEELTTDYKDVIAERVSLNKQYEEILKEDITFNIIKISFKDLPDDIVEAKNFEIIKYLIKENDDELDELLFGDSED